MQRLRRWESVGLLLLLTACGRSDVSWDEVARVQSPDAARDAVLIERNGGATTSFGYEVFVVPRDHAVKKGATGALASLYAATRNAQAYGVNLRWQARDTLAVEYLSARDAVVHDSALTRRRDAVRVVLRPGVRDPDAPSGGMRYNIGHPNTSRPNDR